MPGIILELLHLDILLRIEQLQVSETIGPVRQTHLDVVLQIGAHLAGQATPGCVSMSWLMS